MDLSSLSSMVTGGQSAAGTVASALAPRRASVQVAPKDSSTTNGSSSTSGDSSDITADDFLTLLVSELKNQDPTQPTDPNQYITQLAQVNSLQQLISINQGIGTLDSAVSVPGTTNSGSGTGASSNAISGANN
jgi:flagellar basal-body rod modification protein FlgD